MNGKASPIGERFRRCVQRLARVLLLLREGLWWPPVALLVVAICWFSIASSIPIPSKQTVEEYGQYGDSFGRLTSMFTALGFVGLIITLWLQQRQIRTQEKDAMHSRQKEERGRYEEILFRLLDIYRLTLSEVRVGEATGREVLRIALERVDASVVEEGVNGMPRDLQGRWDNGSLTESDLQRIDYLYFRNFKIVGTEIHPQARLIDTFEVLVGHMVEEAPDHLLIGAYKDLVFAQITFLECRYFFLVALSHPSRARLRDLLAKSGFLDRISRSQIHLLHRAMYEEYWGQKLEQRELPESIPMPQGRIKRAIRAHRVAGGTPKTTYTPIGVRQSQRVVDKDAKNGHQ
jgi:hypothetical protein